MTLDQRYWIWDLVLLLALAIALRLHDLGALSLGGSEVATALTARCLLHPEALAGSHVSLHLPIGPIEWSVAQTFWIFGDSEWSARFPAALAGVLATIWVYLWGSHWFGAWVGRIAGFQFAIWPWSVACGRLANGSSLLLFIVFLFTISVWKMLEGNCLGHPLAEPPLVAGRKPLILRRFFKVIPVTVLGLLCLWISPAGFPALLLLPAYLLTRIAWSWLRGRTADCEFKRSLLYLAAGLVYVCVAATIAVWLNPAYFSDYKAKELGEFWRTAVSSAGIPEVILMGLLLLGSVMAVFRGRPGRLVFLAAWIPVCGALFYPSQTGVNPLYPAIPFLLLLLSMPFAWAFEVARESLNHWAVERKHVSWRNTVSAPLLVGGILFVVWNVLWSPKGTAIILDGTDSTSTREDADWRVIADSIPRIGIKAAIVTVDPLPCLYYLGRADFLYPDPVSYSPLQNVLSGIPVLPDGRALLDFIDSGHEVWIVGSRTSFEKTRQSREGAALWARLTQPPSWVWEGPREVVICWRGGYR